MRAIGTLRWSRAEYEGPGTATVELFELTSSAGGLEMVQRWRAAPNTVVWYSPRFFVVVRWNSPDREAVHSLIRTLQKEFSA